MVRVTCRSSCRCGMSKRKLCKPCQCHDVSRDCGARSGKYDFFYLPIDYKNKCNLGYAFVNFTEPEAAAVFFLERHQQRWQEFNSKKACPARSGTPGFAGCVVHEALQRVCSVRLRSQPPQRMMASMLPVQCCTLQSVHSVLSSRTRTGLIPQVCEVTYARVQGQQALVDHFRNSKFPCADADSLPLVFRPPSPDSPVRLPPESRTSTLTCMHPRWRA